MKKIEFIIPEWSICWYANADASELTDEEIEVLNNFDKDLANKYGNALLIVGDKESDFGYNEIDHFLGTTYNAILII